MWAIFAFVVMMMLLSALVAGDATVTTSGTIAAAPDSFLGMQVALPNAEVQSGGKPFVEPAGHRGQLGADSGRRGARGARTLMVLRHFGSA